MYYTLNRKKNLKGTVVGQPVSRYAGRGFKNLDRAFASAKALDIVIDAKMGRQVSRSGRIVEADQTRYTLKREIVGKTLIRKVDAHIYTFEWIAEASDIHPDERPLASYEEHVERVAIATQTLHQADYQLELTRPQSPSQEMAAREWRRAGESYRAASDAASTFCNAHGIADSQLDTDLRARLGLN